MYVLLISIKEDIMEVARGTAFIEMTQGPILGPLIFAFSSADLHLLLNTTHTYTYIRYCSDVTSQLSASDKQGTRTLSSLVSIAHLSICLSANYDFYRAL